MSLVSFNEFSLGLFLGGPRDRLPPGSWRRFKGCAPFAINQFETRWGSANVQTVSQAHSIFEWEGARYVGAGNVLYKDGSAILSPTDAQHADGRAFRFFVASPTPGFEDWLYVVGMPAGAGDPIDASGGTPYSAPNEAQNIFKIKPDGTIRRVGMAPPSGGGASSPSGSSDPPAAATYLWDVVAFASEYELESLPTGSFGGSESIGYLRAGPFTVTTNGTNDYDLTLPGIDTDDAQLDNIRIFCTQADGDVLFHLADVDEDTATYSLQQAAIDGLDTTRALDTGRAPPGTLQLVTPGGGDTLDQWSDAVVHNGRVWWGRVLSNGSDFIGQSGRVYFSRVGFPEYIQDYIQLTADDEMIERLMVFNGRLYCWSNEAMYEIVGLTLDEAFGFERVLGAPGIAEVDSLARAPEGLFWVGTDKFIWSFNGSTAERVSIEALSPLLWGKSAEEKQPFTGLYGGYAREEYYLSDGITTYAVSSRTGRLREVGVGIYAMHFEKVTGSILAALADEVVLFEEEGQLLEGGDRISWELQTPTLRGSAGEQVFVQTVFLDAELNLTEADVVLVEEDREHDLGRITGNERKTFALQINRWSKDFAFRIKGEAFKRVTINKVEVELRESQSGRRQ